MISTSLASALDVRYVPGTEDSDNPQLEVFNPNNPSQPGTLLANQFQTMLGGIGGTKTVAGFYLDSLLVPTMEGNAADLNDPNHLRFLNAPVFVSDITVQDPTNNDTLTLDGVFGMNFLVASIDLDTWDIRASAFNWLTFDEPNGILGLNLKSMPILYGDVNEDGKVAINDLTVVLTNYGKTTGMTWSMGDFNNDGRVDINDLTIILVNYGHSMASSAIGAAAVPEPSVLQLLAAGLVGLLGFAWENAPCNRPVIELVIKSLDFQVQLSTICVQLKLISSARTDIHHARRGRNH